MTLDSNSIQLRGGLVFILIQFAVFGWVQLGKAGSISNYQSEFKTYIDTGGSPKISIRSFERDGDSWKLIVDAETLLTKVLNAREISKWKSLPRGKAFADTRYARCLEDSSSQPFPLQNDGLTRVNKNLQGWVLSIDMCQSRRQFEKAMFERIISMGAKRNPVPVALCMTRRWMVERADEFDWLKERAREGRIVVTWVNHSSTHPYTSKRPIETNFLLTPGIDLDEEIFSTEIHLLKSGLVPSVFFRFPGLVSDSKLVRRVRELGLITLGADAWLNIGQLPKNGSIILIHGNGNEPGGIEKLNTILDQAESSSQKAKFLSLPLSAQPNSRK